MLIFKTFFKVARKHLPIALIYVIAFLSVFFSMVKSDSKESVFENVKISVCIFDEDNTPESRSLTDFIASKHDIVSIENERYAITDALYYERVNYVITIKKGYAQALAEGRCDDLFEKYSIHNSYRTVLGDQLLNEYISTVSAGIAGGMDTEKAIETAEETLSHQAEVSYADTDKNKFEDSDFPSNLSSYFNYMPYILISVIISALCPVLLAMDKKEIRYRTNCSGIVSSSYVLQIFAAAAVFITAIWLVFCLSGMLIIKGIFHGKALLAMLNSFIFALTATSITVFITSLSPSEKIINYITIVVGLGMSFLCGIFIEQSILSSGVLAAARFLPAYWYIKANDMLAGKTLYTGSSFLVCIAIEAAFAVAFAMLSLLVRKIKLGQLPSRPDSCQKVTQN